MTKKLEELFNLAPREDNSDISNPDVEHDDVEELEEVIDPNSEKFLNNLDKIDLALPAVRGLEASDQEMDELANLARESYQNLMDLGMNVDSRYSSEIFSVASNMLNHAITAKNAKINKKLRMIELQLKKMRLDQTSGQVDELPVGQGHVMDRNELLKHLLGNTQPKP